MARFKDQRFGGRSAVNPVTVTLEDGDGSVARYSFTAVAGDATVQFKDDSGNVGSSISVSSGATVTGPGSDLSGTGKLEMQVTFDATGFRDSSYLDVDVETVSDAELELEPWVPTLGAADGDLFASDGAGGIKAVGSGTYSQGLVRTSYDPGSLTVVPGGTGTTSTTLVDADATNLAVTFTVPANGAVRVYLEGVSDAGDNGTGQRCIWGLRDAGGSIADTDRTAVRSDSIYRAPRVGLWIPVSGLTAGASLTWKWGISHSSGSHAARILCGSNYGPAIMEVWSDPLA